MDSWSHWEQSYPFEGPVTIAIDQREGAIRITGWNQPFVQVKAAWPNGGTIEERLDIDLTESGIRLTAKADRTGFLGLFQDGGRIDLELAVPFGARCEIDASSGPVTIAETHGPVEIDGSSGPVEVSGAASLHVDAGSGRVQVRTIAGPVEVSTGSGRIEVEGALGPVTLDAGSGAIAARRIGNGLTAHTSSGGITLVDVVGDVSLEAGSGSIKASRVYGSSLSAETGSGSVQLEALDVHELEVETGSGSLRVELARIHSDGSFELCTGSGRVTVAVPPHADLNLELESNGRFSYGDLPVQIIHREDEEISARLGQGGPTLRIEANSGAINLTPYLEEVAPVSPTPPAPQPADGSGEQMVRILQMVEEGKLSVAEAEALIRALGGEEGEP